MFEAVYHRGMYEVADSLASFPAHRKTDVSKDDTFPMNSRLASVEVCPDGSFCCKDLNTTCCADNDGLFIDPSNYELKKVNPN